MAKMNFSFSSVSMLFGCIFIFGSIFFLEGFVSHISIFSFEYVVAVFASLCAFLTAVFSAFGVNVVVDASPHAPFSFMRRAIPLRSMDEKVRIEPLTTLICFAFCVSNLASANSPPNF